VRIRSLSCQIFVLPSTGFILSPLIHCSTNRLSLKAIGAAVYQWCEFKSRRGKNKNWTAQRSNSNTVWFNFQTYIIFSINLVSHVTLRSNGTGTLDGIWTHTIDTLQHQSLSLMSRTYTTRPHPLFKNIALIVEVLHCHFLWLYDEFFIILYNILKIAELDCCQIIILSIYVPSTHAYTHVLRLSLDLPYEKR
jgi:hypothetical protein